tara:strand:+ start:280 stop:804 length:525 start_codon:yes stop_codon:yes gene_type:complete
VIHKNKKVKISDNFPLNIAISIAGIFLLGFIYSFSKNATKQGIPIKVTFPKASNQSLAIDVYEKNPIQNIKIEVLNGCGIKGLANRTTEFFRSKQIDVIRSDNANRYDYPKTMIISRNENITSLKAVAKSLQISANDTNHIKIEPDESLGVDVTVILGKDIKYFNNLSRFINNN